MFKKIHFVLLICISVSVTEAYSKDFSFPNVEFSHAKLYFFNAEKSPRDMYFHIYKDGVYAPKKLGDGFALSDKFHKRVNKILSSGMDELYRGLGKCYFPRHGIIYYDEKNRPVASMSICFECDRVMVWSQQEISFDENAHDYAKAERQIKQLLKSVKSEGILAGTSSNSHTLYREYIDSVDQKGIALRPPHIKKTTIEMKDEYEQFERITIDEIKSKIAYHHQKDKTFKKVDSETKNNITYRYNKKSTFIFDEFMGLVEMTIADPEILFIPEIKIGMSHTELYEAFGYKNVTFERVPLIIHQYSDFQIEIHFEKGTITKIHIAKSPKEIEPK